MYKEILIHHIFLPHFRTSHTRFKLFMVYSTPFSTPFFSL